MNDVAGLPLFINANRYEDHQEVPLHSHQGLELVLIEAGSCTIECGERVLKATVGTLVILPANVPHIQKDQTLTKTLYLICSQNGAVFDERPRTLSVVSDRWIQRWMDELCDLSIYVLESKSCCDGIVYALLQRISSLEGDVPGKSPVHPSLSRTIAYIEKNIAASISIEDLAREALVSAGYLHALFRERFGMGPKKYQQNRQMQLARRLLLDPHLPIKEIALTCGYEDVNYFTRLFTKENGCAPGRWRKQGESSFSTLHPQGITGVQKTTAF